MTTISINSLVNAISSEIKANALISDEKLAVVLNSLAEGKAMHQGVVKFFADCGFTCSEIVALHDILQTEYHVEWANNGGIRVYL